MDLGTGDGRRVLYLARRAPSRLVIGIDANLDPLAEAATRAARKPSRGGAPNAWFVRAGAYALPEELREVADSVTVLLPWGSLLAAVLTSDIPAVPGTGVLAGIRTLARPDARLEAVVSLDERDRLAGAVEAPSMARLQAAYRAAGWRIRAVDALDAHALAEVGTTWAKRLAHGRPRESWRIVATALPVAPEGGHSGRDRR